MTTVFEELSADRAQTHALIIGVGAYPHLRDGTGKKLDNDMGLKQLTSPPVSAMSLVELLMERYVAPAEPAPLGSVELLLSPAPGQALVHPFGDVQRATLSNIKTAFDAWSDRCDPHEGNVGLFYFGGHGVQKEDLALLAEDFGANPHRLFENAINLEKMIQGMASCKARVQCYFADACRQIPSDVLDHISIEYAQVLRDADIRDLRADAPIIYATGFGEKAYGAPGQRTKYMEALVRVLKGAGAIQRPDGTWAITTGSVGEAMFEIVPRQRGGPSQQCRAAGERQGGIVRRLDGPPLVPTRILCTPKEAAALAKLSLESKDASVRIDRDSEDEIWEVELHPGDYKASVYFEPNSGYSDTAGDLFAWPPCRDLELRVVP